MLSDLVNAASTIAQEANYVDQPSIFRLAEPHIEPQSLWLWDKKQDEDEVDETADGKTGATVVDDSAAAEEI